MGVLGAFTVLAVIPTGMPSLPSIIDQIADIAESVGAIGPERTRELQETHDPATASSLEVATKNGGIDIHPAEGDELTVDATAKTRHEDDDLDAVSVEIHESGETVSVSTNIPTRANGISVELDVGVPDTLGVAHVVTKNGSVAVRDVTGDTLIETKNGQINVHDVDGTVTVRTKNGAISTSGTRVREATSKNGTLDLELPGLDEAAMFETKNGTIRIAVPRDLDADFSLETKRGRATIEGLTSLVESSSSRHVTGELGAGGPRIDAQTKNGTVTLRALDD